MQKQVNWFKSHYSHLTNTLLRQVKSYIGNNLNPTKVNLINPTQDNFTQSLSIKEILDWLEMSKDIITEPFQYQKMKI